MSGHPESERLPKGVSENCGPEKTAGLKNTPDGPRGATVPTLKEVWWGDLHALGKNAAVAEVFGLDPRENWLDVSNLIALASTQKIRWSLKNTHDGLFAATARPRIRPEQEFSSLLFNAGEALAVALLRARGVMVCLSEKPRVAQGGAEAGDSMSGPRGATGPTSGGGL